MAEPTKKVGDVTDSEKAPKDDGSKRVDRVEEEEKVSSHGSAQETKKDHLQQETLSTKAQEELRILGDLLMEKETKFTKGLDNRDRCVDERVRQKFSSLINALEIVKPVCDLEHKLI